MRADRDKRAVILTAEGQRQSAILTAEGNKQSAILTAEGDRESLILRAQADREAAILRAQGEGQAIQTVFQAIHDGQPDQSLLAYQYLQMMPKIAEGDANKVWIIPSRDRQGARGARLVGPRDRRHPAEGRRPAASGSTWARPTRPCWAVPARSTVELSQANEAVEEAIAEAERSANPGRNNEVPPPAGAAPRRAGRPPRSRRHDRETPPPSDVRSRWWRSSSPGSPPGPSTPWWGRER